jgi:hypothetical protein
MENINFEIFTTKKIEYYRYEISRLKNKEKLSKNRYSDFKKLRKCN